MTTTTDTTYTTVDWRHDAGGIIVEPVHWDADTTRDEIAAEVDRCAAEQSDDAEYHDREKAIAYWTAACEGCEAD